MKFHSTVSLLAAILLPAGAIAQLDVDCDSVAERVKVAVKSKPENVLTIVEDALVAYNGCVGEIVQAAITATDADGDTVKQIVMVAATAADQNTTEIAEAAVEAAPEHAESVRAAFAEVNRDKASETTVAQGATAKTEAKPAVQSSSEPAGQADSGSPAAANDAAVVADSSSGKMVIGDSGKGVISDYEYEYGSGKQLAVDPKAVVQPGLDPGAGGKLPGSSYSGQGYTYGGADISGVYLIPPVASAPPIQEEAEVVERLVIRQRFVSRPRTVIRSVPMSPTAP